MSTPLLEIQDLSVEEEAYGKQTALMLQRQ